MENAGFVVDFKEKIRNLLTGNRWRHLWLGSKTNITTLSFRMVNLRNDRWRIYLNVY